MADIDDQKGAELRVEALKTWVKPQIITHDARKTGSNQLPTFIESTVPTDRPS